MLNLNHFIEKMKNWPFCLLVNIGLTLGIFLCAILGRTLGIQGPALPISVVWPATGLSLAALLLFGYSAGIGVFVGNFTYNMLYLGAFPPSLFLSPIHRDIAAIFITVGSLTQALISAYIIRNYSSPLIFRTVQDIFIFLIPASFLSCLIGSTIGVATLSIAGGLDNDLFLPVWLTFWLGDTMGIYIVTPLIVIWTLQSLEIKPSDHMPSILCIALLFVLFSLITYLFGYPLPHLFVPISIWAAYLFRMHGASLAIFLMAATSVTFAAFHGYEGTSLISLITFIGVTVAASLIIASVVNERAEAFALLDSRNIYLEKEVDVKVELLEQVRSASLSQKRQSRIQDPMSKFAPRVNAFLNDLDFVTKSSQDILEDIQKLLKEQESLKPSEKELFSLKLHQIRQGLSDTMASQKLIAEALRSLI